MRRLAALLIGLAALVEAGAAAAAVAPVFERADARRGDRVRIDCGYVGETKGAVVLYLVRLADVPRLFRVPYSGLIEPDSGPPPRDPRLRLLGTCATGDPNGGGQLVFRVPVSARTGRYTTVVWCKTCRSGGDHWFMAAPNYVANRRAVLRVRA